MYVGRYIFLIIDPCVLDVAVGRPYLRFKTSKLEIVFTILFRLQSSIARRFRLRPCSYLNLRDSYLEIYLDGIIFMWWKKLIILGHFRYLLHSLSGA